MRATVISWAGIAFAAFLAIWSQNPPAALPATAAATEFSAGRAIEHVKAIARGPRPIGSANHAAARDYIMEKLRALGLEPEIQRTTAIDPNLAALFVAGSVQNIVARKKGTGGKATVLLVAHYDSVPAGPGANDDGVGVATLLETARALTTGAPSQNDVLLLFTDSEETGLLGARAFVAEHPAAKEVAVALNFEGRGNGGPVIMFETSPRNGALIRALAKATPYPLANSLSYEIYKRLPNSTDLTVFKRAGVPAMNFAFIHGATHYHTALDNLENVDARTVQHHGSYALALSRHFAAADSAAKAEGDAIYFDTLGFWLVRYSAWLAWPLTAAVLLFFAMLVRVGVRRGELSGRGIALGGLLVFITLIAAAAAVGGAWWLVRLLHPEYGAIAQGDSYRHGLYVLGFAALSLAIAATVLGSFGRRISETNLLVGSLFWWAAAMVALTVWVIGGSYLATWPLLFALLGVAYGFARPPAKVAATALAAVPGTLLIGAFVHLVFIAMAFALAPALILPLVLLWTLLIPLLRRSTTPNRWLFPATVGGVALLFFVLGGLGRFDRQHRQSNHVLYLLDAATQRALWVSGDPRPDQWTEQFFGQNPQRAPLADSFPLGRRPYLQAPAPIISVAPPEAQVLEDITVDGARRLRLRLVSPRGAERIGVRIDAEILSAAVEGKKLPANEPQKGWSLIYMAPPKKGIELGVETKSPAPLQMRVVDESYGLPSPNGAALADRPDYMMAAPYFRSDFSLVSKTYSF